MLKAAWFFFDLQMIKTSGGSRGLWNNPRPVQCSKELQDLMRCELFCCGNEAINSDSTKHLL